jgi:hypothetical protein
MEKNNPALIFTERIYLHKVWVSKKTNIQNSQFELQEGSTVERCVQINKAPLESTRTFKIALAASYTVLISVFASVIYIATILDPKFLF